MARVIQYKKVDLKGLMLKRNYTFKKLSELTNVDPAHLCKYANNKQAMTDKTWLKIKKYL